MSASPAKTGLEFGAAALIFSSKYFDPAAGSRLYSGYLEQYVYAEKMGIDGVMLNELTTRRPACKAKCNIFAAATAKRVKIETDQPVSLDYMSGLKQPAQAAQQRATAAMLREG